MTGIVNNELTTQPSGSYAMESSGVLSNVFGQSLTFRVRREISGSKDDLEIDAAFTSGGIVYPYSLKSFRAYSGVRGEFDHSIVRNVTGWSNITKTTNATQHISWQVDSLGVISLIDSVANYTRPYPLSDGWVGGIGGTPPAFITQESGFIDMSTVVTLAGLSTTWTRYDLQFANGNPSIAGIGITSTLIPVVKNGLLGVESDVTGSLGGNGQFFGLALQTRSEVLGGSKMTHVLNTGSLGGLPLALGEYTFGGPPWGAIWGFGAP